MKNKIKQTKVSYSNSRYESDDEMLKEYLHDFIFLLLNVIINQMRKTFTPYTAFAALMIINSMGWMAYSWSYGNNYYIWEYLSEQITQSITIIIALVTIISYKSEFIKYNDYIYRLSSITLCVLCFLVGAYWLIADIFLIEYSSKTIMFFEITTTLFKLLGSIFLLVGIKQEHFVKTNT